VGLNPAENVDVRLLYLLQVVKAAASVTSSSLILVHIGHLFHVSVYSEQNTQEISVYKGTSVGLSFDMHMVYGPLSGVPCIMVRQFPTSESFRVVVYCRYGSP
jgi:hypothetical protein